MNASRGAAVLLAAAALTVPAALPAAVRARAAPAPPSGGFAWSVRPAGAKGQARRDFFVYSLTPGQRVRDTVVITNLGARPLSLRVYATDAFTTTDGSFALLTADRPAAGIGTWIAIGGAPARTVEPGRSIRVPFTLTVPAAATPGDHSGGVIAAVTEQAATAGGRRVNVDRRVAARVYARVDGPLTAALQVESLTIAHDLPPLGGDVRVTYRVRNTGNVRLSAGARVGITGPFGAGLGRPATRRLPELLPGSAYTLTDRISGVFPAGPLTATLRLAPSGGDGPAAPRPTVRTARWWSTPWVPVALLLLAAGTAVLLRRRRGTRS
ncbi:DUF916 domain-containing protein [Actinomadura madurae]|uniref:DUF916 domain-containing protein n=1 Tax=Actinomadura madurae TaxID=1993 RepID=UPI002026246B|nr:DUF916 domain-containing protein [Actinomadura madurae]MCQ0016590.1 DUF916 domain-containing protein [Actinomadura madurae]URN07360.1 DUF916 domain-containing protein [Actinomadura madurae]